ncbi:MAG: response regulator [Mucilaginibacter sp.]
MKKRILIIEDNEDIREGTAELLTLNGYHVVTANNGHDGVTLIAKLLPDVIICDVVMPGMDGYGVYSWLIQNHNNKNIRFILSTAQSERSHLDKAREVGIENYLVKPFNESELIDSIER